nr:ribonuclease H-like domain-containing protein [Tanacetum cinerariifolium]
MCDKKNSVLFTDTECLVLSSDFKLPDSSQVLLRVPRENNMYNVNLKNIIPSGDLTCLFAKAILDGSNLWHRRLGHVNFKTINKLVKGYLVRGLPSKVFTNDLSCVACKKGKQQRASYKSKTISSVDQPLFRLHMDLFGPTFVKSLSDKAMNKDKGKNPVITITGFRDLNKEFAECINNSSNGVSAAGPLVFTVGLDFTNSTNDFTAAGPLVSVAELNFTNSTNDFSAAGPSNAAMPNLEDLSHNADDVGAEADTNNMESIISVSPIPTTRIHKDHPISQIIGDLSLTTQTKSMARGVRD